MATRLKIPLILWQLVVYSCVVWTCLEAPLSFVLGKVIKEHHLWWDGLFSTIFFLDVYFKVKNTLQLDELVGEPHNTSYKSSRWFKFDLLTSLPFDIIASAFGLHIVSSTVASIRLLRIIRIGKIRSLIYARNFLPKSIKVLSLSVTVAIAIHGLACVWLYLRAPKLDDIYTSYIESLYWVVTTLTTVGYGDIIPTTNGERLFTMVLMLIGAAAYGMIIGNFSSMLQSADNRKYQARQKLKSLNYFMRENNVPKGLQTQTLSFYEHLLLKTNSEEQERILRELPKSLQQDLNLYRKIKMLREIYLFKKCSTPCLKLIASHLEMLFHSPNERVVSKGNLAKALYIIGHGDLEISGGSKILGTLKKGQLFGEHSLLTDTLQANDITSRSYCELYRLTEDSFNQISEKFPDLKLELSTQIGRRSIEADISTRAA